MSRRLAITFQVDDGLTDQEVFELADRIVASIDPDPPVLTYEGSDIINDSSTWEAWRNS